MRSDFAVFILTHGRPESIYTLNTLLTQGYTGKYYFILDNEDSKIEEYKQKFGEEHVVVFNKEDVAKKFDIMDSIKEKNVVVFARNVCFDIAKQLNLNYFLELEDDYVRFEIRYEKDNKLMTYKILTLDDIFESMIDYLNESNVLTVAFAQGGDFIGGVGNQLWIKKLKRKAMNSFFCKVDRDFTFSGRFNDDVNTYIKLGSLGKVFLTISNIDLVQIPTQLHEGGNSDAYLKYGTYVKSFYSVMINPSCVSINCMGPAHKRIHHSIDWEIAVPKIVSDKFKK